jgi:hypothetical protein
MEVAADKIATVAAMVDGDGQLTVGSMTPGTRCRMVQQ